jgi:hypothetical protein
MRYILFYLLLIIAFIPNLSVAQPIIGTSPLNAQPELLEKFNKSGSANKNLYPFGGNVFYEYDTLNLPFFDDFSKDRFKNFNLDLYSNLSLKSLNFFKVFSGNQSSEPDSIWYVFNQPDSFFINNGQLDSVTVPEASLITIVVYDTIVNPLLVKDSLFVYRYQPRLQLLPNGNIVEVLGNIDGRLTKRIKNYIVAPSQSWDKSLWIDRNVYISNDMPISPPTLGAAVFDGLAENGKPYNMSNPNTYGIADYLTSKPLRMELSAGDSVFFSFFYQPQGRGFYPASKDSLVLEFYSKAGIWEHILSLEGTPVDTFKQMIVPITDSLFLYDGFQFRFKNYSSLAANKDHWLVDYVRLDKFRSVYDTTINDVAFVTKAPSILRNYQQMPHTQFIQSEVNQKWDMKIINLHSQNKCIAYKHTFYNKVGNSWTMLTSYPDDNIPGPYDSSCVRPVYTNGYDQNFRHYGPAFSYQFDVMWPGGPPPFPRDTFFKVEHIITNLIDTINDVVTADYNPYNDTTIYYQDFTNYYAYDDGTAEMCMFLGSPGQVAYEFDLNEPDTLRAVQFYFNPQLSSIESNNFELRVWNNLSNTSEDTIYVANFTKPKYMFDAPNRFTTYILDRPVALPSGKVYVGWKQNSFFKMDVGLDRNFDNRDKAYYKTSGNWESFNDALPEESSLMIRPIVGKAINPDDYMGIKPNQTTGDKTTITLFPNPANGNVQFTIDGNTAIQTDISIIDQGGRMIRSWSNTGNGTLDISGIASGLYFIQFRTTEGILFSTEKLIISNH